MCRVSHRRVCVSCVLCANQRNIHYSYNKWFRLKLSMMLIDSDKDNHTEELQKTERERKRCESSCKLGTKRAWS